MPLWLQTACHLRVKGTSRRTALTFPHAPNAEVHFYNSGHFTLETQTAKSIRVELSNDLCPWSARCGLGCTFGPLAIRKIFHNSTYG